MCKLWGTRLFIVSNPCCCCDLRCGVVWVGVFEVLIGLISLYFPGTLTSIERDSMLNDNNQAKIDDQEQPIFDVTVPWSDARWFKSLQKTGCYTIQILAGVLLFSVANGMGGHHFAKFVFGCIWLIQKVLTTLIMYALSRKLRETKHPPLMRYAYYIIFKMIFDLYFFIVVRYYTMDAYDTFKYIRSTTTPIISRRMAPLASKSAPKSEKGGRRIRKKTLKGAPQELPQVIKDIHQKKDLDYHEMEPAPVWNRKNEVIFYGEDYSDWDPHLFFTRWEMLNEVAKGKPKKSMAATAMEAYKAELEAQQKLEKMQEEAEEQLQLDNNMASNAQRNWNAMKKKAFTVRQFANASKVGGPQDPTPANKQQAAGGDGGRLKPGANVPKKLPQRFGPKPKRPLAKPTNANADK